MGDMLFEQQFPGFEVHYPQAWLTRGDGVVDDGEATRIDAHASPLRAFHRTHCLFDNTGAYVWREFSDQRHVAGSGLKR